MKKEKEIIEERIKDLETKMAAKRAEMQKNLRDYFSTPKSPDYSDESYKGSKPGKSQVIGEKMKKKRDSKFRGFDFQKLRKVSALPKYFADEPLFYHPDDCKCRKCKEKKR